ncbi:hypothetical protein D3C71_1760590 [compost metagenome]
MRRRPVEQQAPVGLFLDRKPARQVLPVPFEAGASLERQRCQKGVPVLHPVGQLLGRRTAAERIGVGLVPHQHEVALVFRQRLGGGGIKGLPGPGVVLGNAGVLRRQRAFGADRLFDVRPRPGAVERRLPGSPDGHRGKG